MAPRRPHRRAIAVISALILILAGSSRAVAEPLTFHLPASEALAAVARANAFFISLGKNARGLKLVPGGARFAGQTCAAFGEVYKLGAVTILDGPAAIRERVLTRDGKDAAALESAFALAGTSSWTPPATDAESNIPFWIAAPDARGLRFAAEGVASGLDDGLLGSASGPGVLRFRANVTSPPDALGRYRFLLELYGRTSSQDLALVAFGDRRCFTYVDLYPVDVSLLGRLVDETVAAPALRAALQIRLELMAVALARRDYTSALDLLAVFTSMVISRTPAALPLVASRRIVETTFRVRRGILFSPATATCGNGIRETGEACDGADLGAFSCTNIGFQSGTLTCRPNCRFDMTACIANPVCGNGILEIGEECDRGTDNSDTAPDGCRTSCRRAFCGDGVLDSFEDCEGQNLNGADCESLGYDRGSLRCDPDYCYFDDERCIDDEED